MSVAKMKDGKRWYCFCRYKTWDGQTKQHKKEGFATKREAQEYERDFLAKRQGKSSMLVTSLLDIYLEDRRLHVKQSSYRSIETVVETWIRPKFGQMQCDAITPAMVRQWHNELLSGDSVKYGRPMSRTTVKSIAMRLSSVLDFGVKYYGLQNNPCKRVEPVSKARTKEMQFLTVGEFARFLAAESRSDYRLAFLVLFWTGMREGELLALLPSDFDAESKTITVSKTYIHLHGEHIVTPPKTEKSNRQILLPDFLSDELAAYIAELPGVSSDTRIFDSVTADNLRAHCISNCKRAGVPRIRVHDLRHSHASLLINNGASPLVVSQRLGHDGVQTTLTIYAHLYRDSQSDIVRILGDCYDSATAEI